MRLVAREMHDGAADDYVERRVGKRHAFDWLRSEIAGRQRGSEPRCELSNRADRRVVCIGAGHVEASAHEVHEVASAAAARVEDRHPVANASPMDLIEQVDVDIAELAAKVVGGLCHRRPN